MKTLPPTNSRSQSARSLYLIAFWTAFAAFGLSAAAIAQPTLSKVFTPNTIGPGNVSTITFTITNGSAAPVTDLAFTDVLPTVPGDMDIATPSNASTTCDVAGGGIGLTAPDGGATVTFSDGEVGGFESCTVTVDVTAATPGFHTNPAVTLDSSAGSSASLPIDLEVVTTLPGFSKSFAPGSVPLGIRSTLTFTIDNGVNANPVPSLDFTDNLPTGMIVADPPNASTDCISAGLLDTTLTAVAGSSVITLDANGSILFPGLEVLPIGATCTVTVDVEANGVGNLANVTNDLLADFTSAGKASDFLEVTVTPLAFTKSFTDDPTPPGSNVTLEFRIDNFDRIHPATGVAFTDDLTTLVPALAGLTFDSLLSNDCGGMISGVGGTTIGLSGGTVAPETFCTIRTSLTVPAGGVPGTYTNTTSSITATVDGSPVVGNMASEHLFVEPVPLLTKEFLKDGTLDPDPVINPGDDVVLRFTITNTSTTSMATDITFSDELTDGGPLTGFLPFPLTVVLPPTPCGVGSSLGFVFPDSDRQAIELTGGTLDPAPGAGSTCTFDLTVSVPADLGPAIYSNTTGQITATVDGATRVGDPASDTLTLISAPGLIKEFTDDPVPPGNTVTLDFTLIYPADASGDATAISFTDNLAPVLASLVATGLPLTEACDPDGPGGNPGTGTLSGSAGDTLLTFMDGTLSPGESCTISVPLDVPGGAAPGTYANTTSGVSATVEGLPTTSHPGVDDLKVAGLVFTKEFLGDPVIAGDTVTLRFTIDNIHPTDDATISFFTDTLTANLPGLAATGPPSVNTCGGTLSGTTSLVYVGGSVLSGAMCTVEVEVLVPAGAADGGYLNITSNLSAVQGGSVTIDPATDTLKVDSDLLHLTKEFTDDPVAPGDSVTLEFTLTNLDATQPASDIDFSDDLEAALTGLTYDSLLLNDCGAMVAGLTSDTITVTGGSLAAGGSCTIRTSLSVPGGAAAGIYPNTTSAVTGMNSGFAVSGATATDDLEVIQLLEFSKAFDGPTTATGMATLTFTITNPGSDAAADIFFSDDLDAVISGLIATSLPALPCGPGSAITGISFLTFSGGELPPAGGMCSFDVDVLVPATAAAGTFPNTTSDLFRAGLPVADPATADLTIEPPPTFAKVFGPDSILASGVSTLTFTIDNSASAFAASSLAFTDTLPAAVVVATPSVTVNGCGGTLTATAGSGTISLSGGSVGASATCTVDVDVTSVTAGTHVNTSGELTSSSGNSGTSTDTLTVNPAVDISVTKTDGVTSAVPGMGVTYTITVANAGPSLDPSVSLIDTFPSPPLTCTFTSVAAGGATGNTAAGAGDLAEMLSMPVGSSVVYTATCAIDSDATGTLSNTATATPSITDTVPGNNSATDDDTVLTPEADLSITKTDSQDPVAAGGALSYTLTVTNSGPSDASNVVITETLPSGVTFVSSTGCAEDPAGVPTCSLGTLTAGNAGVATIDVTIDAPTTGTLVNTVSVSSDAIDPDTGDNSTSEDTTVDSDIPTVTQIDSVSGTGDGILEECEEVRVGVSQLLVTFSESVQNPPGDSDPDDVTNPANFRLVAAGPDKDLATTVCGAPAGDDVSISIDSVLYDDGTHTAALQLASGASLGEDVYRLLACGSTTIRDTSGNPLDGNGDGTGGDDFVRTFRVERTNRLVNGQFDCNIDSWTAVSTLPTEIEHDPLDIDAVSVSGSAGITNLSASNDFALGQCVDINGGDGCTLNFNMRMDAAPGLLFTVHRTCEFFTAPTCGGDSLGVNSTTSILEDSGGAWLPHQLNVSPAATTESVLCSLAVRTAAGDDFFAYVDDAMLSCSDQLLFTDGFESGDTTAWSSTQP